MQSTEELIESIVQRLDGLIDLLTPKPTKIYEWSAVDPKAGLPAPSPQQPDSRPPEGVPLSSPSEAIKTPTGTPPATNTGVPEGRFVMSQDDIEWNQMWDWVREELKATNVPKNWDQVLDDIKQRRTTESVDRPAHYSSLAIEPGDYACRNKLPFWEGNAIKYITRHRQKDGEKDVRKAIDCLQRILAEYREGRV